MMGCLALHVGVFAAQGTTEMPAPLRQEASFNSETTRLLGLAYDRACAHAGSDSKVREAVAKRIIEAAKRGERKLEKLADYGCAPVEPC
jgi:hypothetical protein